MDDFGKMLEIVKRVEMKVQASERRAEAYFRQLEVKIEGLSKWRWRIEGALFLASGVISIIVTAIIETMAHR